MWRSPFLVLLVFTAYVAMTLAIAQPTAEVGYPPVNITGVDPNGASASVIVVLGDHLWKIAKTHLTELEGKSPANSEVTPYWRDVISTNRAGLRSGNPDLIYPGELVQLPAFVSGQQ